MDIPRHICRGKLVSAKGICLGQCITSFVCQSMYREKVVVNATKVNLIIQGQGYLNMIIAWNNTLKGNIKS